MGALRSQAKLIAAWGFDEGQGKVAKDVSGNGHDGTINGAKWVDGKFGKALEFNGDGDYVLFPHADSLNVKKVSVVAWVYPKGWNPDLNAIAQKWEDGSNRRQYQLTLYQQKNWWYVSDAGNNWPRTDTTKVIVNLNEWTHLAGTYDGATMRAYVNGVLDAERAQPNGVFASNVDGMIGGYGPNTPVKYGQNRHFKGVIDEVYFFDEGISEADVRNLMKTSLVLAIRSGGKLPVRWAGLKSGR
jgi:hypothetical protein